MSNRYSGQIGLRRAIQETSPGIWEQPIDEIDVSGDIRRAPSRWRSGENIQETVRVNHVISIMIPGDVEQSDFDEIVWATWQTKKWAVVSIEYEHPRLFLGLGGKWNNAQTSSP